MPNWLVVTIAVVGVIVSVVGFAMTQRRESRQELEKRVEQAVNSRFGALFVDLMQTSEAMSKRAAEVRESSEKAVSDATQYLGQVESAKQAHLELEERLNEAIRKAEEMVPNIATFAAATPAALISKFDGEQNEAARRAILAEIGKSQVATSEQFERAGDRARRQLDDYELARELYVRAVEKNPSNASAQAELAGMDLLVGNGATRRTAMDRLKSLFVENPSDHNAVAKLLNEYIDRGMYADMKDTVQSLLNDHPDQPMLWRNLAIALAHSAGTQDDINTAYMRALELATAQDDDPGYVNTAKAYVVWLARQGMFDDADLVLNRAMTLMPQEEDLYFTSYKLEILRGQVDKARRALQVMARLGGRREKRAALSLQLGLDGLDYLNSERHSEVFNKDLPDAVTGLLELLEQSED